MGFKELIKKEQMDPQATARVDSAKFRVRRVKEFSGFQTYLIENLSGKERIAVNRFLFDRFRSTLQEIVHDINESPDNATLNRQIKYKLQTFFSISPSRERPEYLVIREANPKINTTGKLHVPLRRLDAFIDLLYDVRLLHPNDTLTRIVDYHKTFLFSFDDSSQSLTSSLNLRKEVLSSIEDYTPRLRSSLAANQNSAISEHSKSKSRRSGLNDEASDSPKAFKSRLAERAGDGSYQVDYEALFSNQPGNIQSLPSKKSGRSKKNPINDRDYFPLPLSCGDVKTTKDGSLRCELTTEDLQHLRENFLKDNKYEFFIGFEIFDAIFKNRGKLKSFRFPLYTIKVRIETAGKNLIIQFLDEHKAYLNHIAICNLSQSFGKAGSMESILDSLLNHSIEVKGQLSRVYLSRIMPYHEDIFDKTRDFLLGGPKDNGKGGVFNKLNIIGIDCDLESVYLYRTPKVQSSLAVSLVNDLSELQAIANTRPKTFYNSLLGQFLTPERHNFESLKSTYGDPRWIPGAISQSTRNLLDKLDKNNLVMLEGPPGTGKTFTIMNLFIHSVCAGKRVLVVSDQEGGIQALNEKLMSYLTEGQNESANHDTLHNLWRNSVKVIDKIPDPQAPLSSWVSELKDMLGIDNSKEVGWDEQTSPPDEHIKALDQKVSDLTQRITDLLQERLGSSGSRKVRVSKKRQHATTDKEIKGIIEFLKFIGNVSKSDDNKSVHETARYLLLRFIRDREYMSKSEHKVYLQYFAIPSKPSRMLLDDINRFDAVCALLLKKSPKTLKAFDATIKHVKKEPYIKDIRKFYRKNYPPEAGQVELFFRYVYSMVRNPMTGHLRQLRRMLAAHKKLVRMGLDLDKGAWLQLKKIHDNLQKNSKSDTPLSLEICRYSIELAYGDRKSRSRPSMRSVQSLLNKIEDLQNRKDQLIRKRFLLSLNEVAKSAFQAKERSGPNPITAIQSILDSLKTYGNLKAGEAALKDLQTMLWENYPFWICRKQVVPFLLPCLEKSFDLVIVDEATQCRVDDALPLLFRGKKLMVVGDDKQTVLTKDSPIDDYLFKEFDLDEHLRTQKAYAIKGGGSNIFALIKGIRQASVLLDEHYRCPPEIIEFSNKYVYGNALRTMKWKPFSMANSVVVDYTEERAVAAERRTSGKYKGLETKMIDRFLDYIESSIYQIEKQTGKRINLNHDVAICYFLLKNEPYFKEAKAELIQRLNRGDELLDGAGAALQGKERDYIFYFWDINRSNLMAFRQGDDESKRRGELNVLMSRPKVRAYHYLHKNFKSLPHHSATITDYLWQTYNSQNLKSISKKFRSRLKQPAEDIIPWNRTSGQLIFSMIQEMLATQSRSLKRSISNKSIYPEYGLLVADNYRRVDLTLVSNQTPNLDSVGIVDLAAFEPKKDCGQEVVDYYFRLKRSTPKINPVFVFMHELADTRTETFQLLVKTLAKIDHALLEEVKSNGEGKLGT